MPVYPQKTKTWTFRFRHSKKRADDLEILVTKSKVLPVKPNADGESKLEEAKDIIDLKPKFCGIGVNVNELFRKNF